MSGPAQARYAMRRGTFRGSDPRPPQLAVTTRLPHPEGNPPCGPPVCAPGGVSFENKFFRTALRWWVISGVFGLASRDWPVTSAPFPTPPPPSFRGLERPPPPTPTHTRKPFFFALRWERVVV